MIAVTLRDETERVEYPCTRGHHAPVVLNEMEKKNNNNHLFVGREQKCTVGTLAWQEQGGRRAVPCKRRRDNSIPIHRRSITEHCGPSALCLGEDQPWGGQQEPCNISQWPHLGNHCDFFNHILSIIRKLLRTMVQPEVV